MDLIDIVKTNLKNIPGKGFQKKYLILECDDWGGIRMPSKEVYEKLLNEGLSLEKSRFNYDTLETTEDLEQLFEVLDSVKDKNGHSAVMTPVANMTNPDFKKIKESGFTEYHYEKFTETLISYGRGTGVFSLWKQGIEAGIFIPELHGREHLSVQLWLQKLREGNKDLLFAFNNGFVSLSLPDIHPAARGFRPEFYFNSDTQIPFLKNSIRDAVRIFKEIFGYQPVVFVPGNAIFHPVFEEDVAEQGIKYLYVNRKMSYGDEYGGVINKSYISGQKGPDGLTYYTRNCVFEPSGETYKGIDFTLMQIAAAFRWGKPANISTHRVNFAGGIDASNRKNGLKELKALLKAIIRRWPDVEFAGSRKALDFYNNS